jgi:hypothetical protein
MALQYPKRKVFNDASNLGCQRLAEKSANVELCNLTNANKVNGCRVK